MVRWAMGGEGGAMVRGQEGDGGVTWENLDRARVQDEGGRGRRGIRTCGRWEGNQE